MNEEKQRRYRKFLLEKKPDLPKGGHEGLNIIPTNISEEEARKNIESHRFIEGVFTTITELFNCENIGMETTGHSISFSIPQEGYSEYLGSGPEIQSPKLDREKLREAAGNELAGAIIDLFLDRKKWNHKITSKKLTL